MSLVLYIGGALCLLVLAYQDFRSRTISVAVLAILLIILTVLGIQEAGWQELIAYAGINVLLVVVQLLLVKMVFAAAKRESRFADELIGWGDIVFLLIVAVAFSTINFIFFYITGLILTLIIFSALRVLKGQAFIHIPLAGALSLWLIAVGICELVNPVFQRYDDGLILGIMSISI